MRCLLPVLPAATLTLGLALIACGDNTHDHDHGADAAPGDGDAPIAAPPRAIAVSGDFATTGVLSVVNVVAGTVQVGAVAGVAGGDPVLRRAGAELLVVNRASGDNVTILDLDTLALVDQLGTGAGSNPQDAAVVGTKLYVAALASPDLLVFDRAAGNALTNISLASLDAVDGHPDCVSVLAVGTRLFVACGVLDETFAPRGNGKVAVIDTLTATVTSTFDLPARNPVGLLQATPSAGFFAGDLVLGTVPDYQDFSTGCLVRISTGASPAATCATSNAALGGYVNHVEPAGTGGVLWIAATGFDAGFDSFGALRGVDLGSGALWDEPVSQPGQVIVDLAACPDDYVVVSDKAMAGSGLRIFRGTTEVTTAPLGIGMPPGVGNNLVCF
ncbi:MAG: hypothetical protein KA190_08350 [Kofleriaceae bacterium]|nr:hypothetical protein [Kofleriaceae bacterium]